MCYSIEADNFTFIRLVGGSGPYEGRVEVYYGHWGTVCGDYYFDIDEANVVCEELGYQGATRYYTYAYFGQGSGPIWLAHLACTGNETSLHYCSHDGIGNIHYCDHYDDVGVVCQGINL